MTRVIRNRAGFYFKQGGEWTEHFPEAEKFGSFAAAATAQAKFQLQEVDLVLVINGQPSVEWDVVLPLSRAGRSGALR